MLTDVALRPGEEGWYAVAKASELKAGRPLKRWLFGFPIVVFGSAESPSILVDRCPHRSAPLSTGRVVDGMVECPYHGWRFDGSGRCRKIPCLPGDPPPGKATSLKALVRYGLVFARMGEGAAEPSPPILNGTRGFVHIWSGLAVKGRLADVAENFLDATHTITVHRGLLRGPGAATPAKVIVTGRPGEIEVAYKGEGRPTGIIAMIFEGQRKRAVGRFRGPNITDVEFHGKDGIRIACTSYLTPTQPGMVSGFAIFTVPGNPLTGRLKFLALKPFAMLVNRQDMRILNSTDDNHALFGRPPHVVAPTDYAASGIAAILEGELPPAAGNQRTLDVLL